MFTVILYKGGGVRCEILCNTTKNAGTPPNNFVKIKILKFYAFKILEFDFFQFSSYTNSRKFKKE